MNSLLLLTIPLTVFEATTTFTSIGAGTCLHFSLNLIQLHNSGLRQSVVAVLAYKVRLKQGWIFPNDSKEASSVCMLFMLLNKLDSLFLFLSSHLVSQSRSRLLATLSLLILNFLTYSKDDSQGWPLIILLQSRLPLAAASRYRRQQ